MTQFAIRTQGLTRNFADVPALGDLTLEVPAGSGFGLHGPALVFLDEPTAGLDPVAAAGLRDDLCVLAARQGSTIFLTTHNMAEAEKLCTLVAVIRQGKLLAVGSPAQLRARGGGQRTE